MAATSSPRTDTGRVPRCGSRGCFANLGKMGVTGHLSSLLEANRDRIVEVVRSRGGVEAYVFGSAVRGDGGRGSDLDLLVLFKEDASLFEQVHLKEDLEEILGCNVDVLRLNGLRQALDGKGHYRREMILKQAVPL